MFGKDMAMNQTCYGFPVRPGTPLGYILRLVRLLID